MKILLTILMLLFISVQLSAQIVGGKAVIDTSKKSSTKNIPIAKPIVQNEEEENQVFTKVEVDAEFPGGQNGWLKYLQKTLNANVPANNNAPSGRYMVIVKFTVSKTGEVYDVVGESNNGYGMEQEVIRIIKKGPKWIPAMQNGTPILFVKKQPVVFIVSNK
jgi:periplasmic protein TonB